MTVEGYLKSNFCIAEFEVLLSNIKVICKAAGKGGFTHFFPIG